MQGAQAPSPGAVFSQARQRCGPRGRDSPLLASLQGKQNLRLLEKNRSFACIHCTYFYTKSSGKILSSSLTLLTFNFVYIF